jgi:hypothetical protein
MACRLKLGREGPMGATGPTGEPGHSGFSLTASGFGDLYIPSPQVITNRDDVVWTIGFETLSSIFNFVLRDGRQFSLGEGLFELTLVLVTEATGPFQAQITKAGIPICPPHCVCVPTVSLRHPSPTNADPDNHYDCERTQSQFRHTAVTQNFS